jgi:hypothetical protein
MNRKDYPLFSGVLKYFPDALLEVAHCSKVGNDQHNPGEKLHWAKEKSTDEPDALLRHLADEAIDPGGRDDDGVRHLAKVAWRALAFFQRELEAEYAAKIKTVTTQINVTEKADAALDDLADTAALERLRQPLRRAACDEYAHWFPHMETGCFCGQVTRPSPAEIGIDRSVRAGWERVPVSLAGSVRDAYVDEEGDVNR